MFEIELKRLGRIDSQMRFLKLVSLIKDSKIRNYSPSFELLKMHCEDKFLIQLWEMSLINDYDIELIKKYFHFTSAENKRSIILKVNNNEKDDILNYHFKKLESDGLLYKLNNSLKTLLDIAYRNKESRRIELYMKIRAFFLLSTLSPNELIDLWLNDYIDYLPERFIVKNFNINNSTLVKTLLSKKEATYIEIILKIFENYFLQLTSKNFNSELPQIVKRLIIFEKEYKSRYEEVVKVLNTIFDELQKFTLWVFNVPIEFNAYEYIRINHKNINAFYKLKYFIHSTIDRNSATNTALLEMSNINEEALLSFALNSPWNNLIHPTEIVPLDEGARQFLMDIQNLIRSINWKILV